MAYHQYERGMLSEERLVSALRPLLSDIHRPLVRQFWDEVKGNQIPAFREYFDRRSAELSR
jgi:hypothetical protein